MAISRKNFSALSVSDLRRTVDDLSQMIEKAAEGGGDIDLKALEKAVESTDDLALVSAFEGVRLEYASFRGDSERARTEIREKDVKSVMNMMLEAKLAVGTIDKNSDGKLDREEVLHSRYADIDPGSNIVKALAVGSYGELEFALSEWLEQTPQSAAEMSMRRGVYFELEHLVSKAKPSVKGKRALTAFLQMFLVGQREKFDVEGSKTVESRMKTLIKSAEKNFFLSLFGVARLDDSEIAEFLGRFDFDAFSDEVDAAMQERFGTSFTEAWLDGVDVDPNNAESFRFKSK